MVPTGYIASAINNLALAITADHIHMNQMVATVHQLGETNKILGDSIKHFSETNTIMESQGQDEKNHQTKPRVTLQNWTLTGIAGHMVLG